MNAGMLGPFSALALFLAAESTATGQAQQRMAIESRFAEVNGIRLHYLPKFRPKWRSRVRGPA
jgi:hypothetical protein